MVKRLFDVVCAAAGLVVSAPIVALAAVGIKLTDPGPVFYRARRVGYLGRQFTMFKLRTMRSGESDTGPVITGHGDDRISPIGKILRKTKVDELPQLFNVLRGDMSIVGPRPERPHFVEQFKHKIPQYMLRHKVKAGITGWAQVNGWRGNTSIEKRIEYDLYYIENWSVALDLKIMWLTLLKGFFHKHAY